MRLFNAMTPARSWEEAAMTVAKINTMSGGAALGSVRTIQQEWTTVEVPQNKNSAAGKGEALPRRRSALRHVLERQF